MRRVNLRPLVLTIALGAAAPVAVRRVTRALDPGLWDARA
jgi:hypothetical protein